MVFKSCKAIFLLALCSCAASMSDPVGHMMPFGHHRPPSVVIDEFQVSRPSTIKLFGSEF